jgi:hypothetical protein
MMNLFPSWEFSVFHIPGESRIGFNPSFQVTRSCHSGRTTDYHRLEGDYPVGNGSCLLLHQKVVAVGKSEHGIGGLFSAFNQVGIYMKFGPVQSGQLDHDILLPCRFVLLLLPFGSQGKNFSLYCGK